MIKQLDRIVSLGVDISWRGVNMQFFLWHPENSIANWWMEILLTLFLERNLSGSMESFSQGDKHLVHKKLFLLLKYLFYWIRSTSFYWIDLSLYL